MGFYEEISKYYDYIFPVSAETVDYIRRIAGKPPKNILDVACGTGGYSLELEKHGYNLMAVDIDKEMIDGLRVKALNKESKIEYLQTSMLELKEKLYDKVFDALFCIGNSLAHLDCNDEIGEFLNNAKSLLIPGGTLLIQTINFDRVLAKDVRSLPTICNEAVGLSFERFYRYERTLDKVFFKTILTVDGKRIENEIPLTSVRHDEMVEMLKNAGFTEVNVFGDFSNSKYDKENSYLMVIEAK
jgi:2-polyprenyl-3-methyl-5-hydroxy-6-metoxy-1,4-benzoquinol methylase